MPTLAAGASASISLTPGDKILLEGLGNAVAALTLPDGRVISQTLQVGAPKTLGPFDVTGSATLASSGGALTYSFVDYEAQAPGSSIPPTGWAKSQLAADVQASLARADALAQIPATGIGFNSYELFYRHLVTTYDYQTVIDWLVSAKAPLVRIAYPAFSAADWTTSVFAAGVPARDFVDADFQPAFLSKSDAVFSACRTAGLKLLLCLFWGQVELCALTGDTVQAGPVVGSATHTFCLRFVRWFAKKYGANREIAAASFINEPILDQTGATGPTYAQYAAFVKSLSDELHVTAPAIKTTTDVVLLTANSAQGRPTFDSYGDAIRQIFAAVDVAGVHVYANSPSLAGNNFVGSDGFGSATLRPGTANTLGFESAAGAVSAYAAVAASVGRALWITEAGVPTDVEADTTSLKADRLARACLDGGADVALLWNAANVASPQANQVVWQIQPGTTRGNKFLALAQAHNAGVLLAQRKAVSGGVKSLRERKRPRQAFTCVRSAGARLTVTSTAAMTSATQAVMFWFKRTADFNNFENIFDVRGTGNTSGFLWLAGPVGATDPEYFDVRGAAGSIVATTGRLPRKASPEWTHIALIQRTIAGINAIELWMDGLQWYTLSSGVYSGIPSGTTLYIGGNATNGAPIAMQDVCLAPSATPEDIWAHMDGAVLPQAYLHIRAGESGVLDLSRSAAVVAVGAGVTFGAV